MKPCAENCIGVRIKEIDMSFKSPSETKIITWQFYVAILKANYLHIKLIYGLLTFFLSVCGIEKRILRGNLLPLHRLISRTPKPE